MSLSVSSLTPSTLALGKTGTVSPRRKSLATASMMMELIIAAPATVDEGPIRDARPGRSSKASPAAASAPVAAKKAVAKKKA